MVSVPEAYLVGARGPSRLHHLFAVPSETPVPSSPANFM
jgi:hypothetical protein